MQAEIQQLSKDEHEFDVEIPGNDEISTIYNSFNNMRERVKETESKLKEHSNELELQASSRTLELDEKIELLEKQTQETMDLAVQREKINLALQDEISERKWLLPPSKRARNATKLFLISVRIMPMRWK